MTLDSPRAVSTAASATSTSRLASARSQLLNGPAILVLALCFNSAGVFAFHIVVSRLLGPSRYGALGALLALALILSVASGAVTMAVTQRVAASPPATGWSIARQYRVVGVGCLVLAVAGACGAAEIKHYLHLGTLTPVVLLVLFGEVVLCGLVPRGVLVGQHRYRLMGGAVAIGAVVRVIAGAALAPAFGTSGAIAAYGAAEGATTLIALVGVVRHRQRGDAVSELNVSWRSLGLALAAFGGMWTFSATDTFLARHLLSSVGAGIYVAASVAGSAALWLPYTVTGSVFARLSAEAHAEDTKGRDFRNSLVATVLMAGGICVALVLVPGLVIRVLFGASYEASARVLVFLAVSNGLQGVTGFLVSHQLAHRRWTVLLPWAGVVGLVTAIYLHHQTPRAIALAAVLVSLALCVAVLAGSVRIVTGSPRHRD